jgi:hypothetical protein
MRGGDQPLQWLARNRPKLEAIADAKPQSDQPRTELEAVTAIQREVAPRLKGMDQSVRAALRKAETGADFGDLQALGLGGKELQDVERPVGGLDGRDIDH